MTPHDPPSQIPNTKDEKHTEPNIDMKMLESLVCPISKLPLHYNKNTQELWSRSIRLAFKIENDIPILLPALARTLDEEEVRKIFS